MTTWHCTSRVPVPPSIRHVETPSTLQLTKPMHNELLGIEYHGLARTTLPDADVVQYGDSRRIETEEVQPPSGWSTALRSVEECAMTVLQQSMLKVLAMATHDEGLVRERPRQRPAQVLGAIGSAQSLSRGFHIASIRTVAKFANKVAARVGRSFMVSVFIEAPKSLFQKYGSRMVRPLRATAPLCGAGRSGEPSGRP